MSTGSDRSTPHGEAHVRLREAERIVDVMNAAADLEGDDADRARLLLRSLVDLLARPGFSTIVLLSDLEAKTGPTLVRRHVYAPIPGQRPVLSDAELEQEATTRLRPMIDVIMEHVLGSIRVPYTWIASDTFGHEAWYRETFLPAIREANYLDSLGGAWAATPARAVLMLMMRGVDDPPFAASERTVMALMLRAVAPFIDRKMFRPDDPLAEYDLSERQREVLQHLLHGSSEKEIASAMHRSVHTIHTHVRQLYARLDVSSRGELMAAFVDRAVVRAAGLAT